MREQLDDMLDQKYTNLAHTEHMNLLTKDKIAYERNQKTGKKMMIQKPKPYPRLLNNAEKQKIA